MKIPKAILKKIYRIGLSVFVLKDFKKFENLREGRGRFNLSFKNIYPQLRDKTVTTHFDRHYIYHTGWAARKVRDINPDVHIDISSSLYFSSILSAFIPVKFYDYRPAALELDNFSSLSADLTNLHFESNSIPSLSCMHTIEHIGLGRYGDPLDPDGDLKAIEELKRVVAPGGSLLFVVPIGGEALIEFNAHRIYTYSQVISYFINSFELEEFSLIPEHTSNGGLITHASEEQANREHYAAGCFWFKKKMT